MEPGAFHGRHSSEEFSFNAALKACEGRWHTAVDLLEQLRTARQEGDIITFASLRPWLSFGNAFSSFLHDLFRLQVYIKHIYNYIYIIVYSFGGFFPGSVLVGKPGHGS